MGTVGTVTALLKAESSAFTKATKEAADSIKSVGEAASGIGGLLAGAFAIAGIGLSIEGIKGMVTETMEATVSAYRLSGALGITTASLQGLRTAGLLQAGLSAEEFDGVLGKLTKTLGGAEEGNTKATASLAAIGLKASDLKGLGVDQAFLKIGDSISKIADPTARSAAEVALFGREGMKLGPMFSEGSEGIKKAMEEAGRLGVTMSEVDAAKVVGAHEQLEKVQLAIQGIENKFTVALAPVIESIAEKLVSLLPAADTMQSGIMSAMRFVASGVGYVVDAYHVLELAGEGVALGLVAADEGVIKVINKLAEGVVYVANLFGAGWKLPQFMAGA